MLTMDDILLSPFYITIQIAASHPSILITIIILSSTSSQPPRSLLLVIQNKLTLLRLSHLENSFVLLAGRPEGCEMDSWRDTCNDTIFSYQKLIICGSNCCTRFMLGWVWGALWEFCFMWDFSKFEFAN